MAIPSIERQYECVRIIADCYQSGRFDELFPLLTNNVEQFSQFR